MIEIDLGEETTFEVTFRGEVYTLREPTVAEIDSFREQSDGGGIAYVTKFLIAIGMPEAVVKTLPMTKAKLLIDRMMDELSKKK